MADRNASGGTQDRTVLIGEHAGPGGGMGDPTFGRGELGGDDFGRGGSGDRTSRYATKAGLHGPAGIDYGGGGFERGAVRGGFGTAGGRPRRGWWERRAAQSASPTRTNARNPNGKAAGSGWFRIGVGAALGGAALSLLAWRLQGRR